MTLRTSFLALLFALVIAPALHASNPRLLAYYGYWDKWSTPAYNASAIPYDQVTHIVHSNIAPAAAGDGSLAIPNGFLEPDLIPRAHAAGVKVELCVSGNPNLFVTIAANPQFRATFAQNIAAFAIAHGYDGVDFDYEVPTDDEQAVNFTGLIQNLRDLMPAGEVSDLRRSLFQPRLLRRLRFRRHDSPARLFQRHDL